MQQKRHITADLFASVCAGNIYIYIYIYSTKLTFGSKVLGIWFGGPLTPNRILCMWQLEFLLNMSPPNIVKFIEAAFSKPAFSKPALFLNRSLLSL